MRRRARRCRVARRAARRGTRDLRFQINGGPRAPSQQSSGLAGGLRSDLSHCAPSAVRAYRRLSAGKGGDWCATVCVGRQPLSVAQGGIRRFLTLCTDEHGVGADSAVSDSHRFGLSPFRVVSRALFRSLDVVRMGFGSRGGDGPSGPRTHDGDGMGCEQFVHTYEIAAPSCSLKC